MNVTIPAKIRQAAYIVFGVLAAAQTAAYAAYGSIHIDPPSALIAGSAAFAAISTAPFIVAVLNIPKDDPNLATAQYAPVTAAAEPADVAPDADAPLGEETPSDYDTPTPDGAVTGPADEPQPEHTA